MPPIQSITPEEAISLHIHLLEAGEHIKQCMHLIKPTDSKEYQINTGLLCKASKLHASILSNLGDSMTLSILSRILLETCMTLEYLVLIGGQEIYDQFLTGDSMHQRNLLEFTKQSRLNTHPLAQAIIDQINNGFQRDGVDPKQIPVKPSPHPASWHPTKPFYEMANELGPIAQHWYATSYDRGSRVVHPSWQDIIQNHLYNDPSGTGYLLPNINTPAVRVTEVEEIVCIIFVALHQFVIKYAPDRTELLDRMGYMHTQLHNRLNSKFDHLTSQYKHEATAPI